MSTNHNTSYEVQIRWDSHPTTTLYQTLTPYLPVEEIKLEIRELDAHGAVIDPTVLVAIVSGTSAAISALITGILQLIQGRHQTIVLQAANGRRLEIPANTSKERIQELIVLLEGMEVERIRITDR